MKCDDCQLGNFSLCKHYSFIGSREQGSFAEYVVIPAVNAIKYDSSIPYEQAAMFEPSTVAVHGLLQMRYRGGETVAILGCGTIGIFTLQWAKILGAKQIVAFDIDDGRLLRLYEIIEGRMPLFLHMGDARPQYRFSEPGKLAKVLKMFPRLKVVAAHYGGYQAWDEASRCLWGHPNVWYDCSSSLWAMSPEKAKELTLGCGEDRVMYGTDYPVYSLIPYFQLFERIDLTDEQREKLLYKNAKSFIEAIERDAREYHENH